MFESITESFWKILDGLQLLLSGTIGIAYWLLALLIVLSLFRWLVKEPVKALRILFGIAVAIVIIFSIPVLDVFLGVDLSGLNKGVLFGLHIACFYFAYKAFTLIVGKHGDSPEPGGGA